MELTQEQREQLKSEIIRYFQKERDEKIGTIAAESHLNFFIDLLEKEIHNQTVVEVLKTVENRVEELRFDLEYLIKFKIPVKPFWFFAIKRNEP
jgi:uncharacterized protein (DUF2164 family)